MRFTYADDAGHTILCFHYEEISPNTVLIPARRLRVQRDVQHSWLHQEMDDLSQVWHLADTVCALVSTEHCSHVSIMHSAAAFGAAPL